MFQKDYNNMVTLDELCEMLAIGRNTAYSLLKSSEIKAFKIGRVWKIPREAVSEYVLRSSRLYSK